MGLKSLENPLDTRFKHILLISTLYPSLSTFLFPLLLSSWLASSFSLSVSAFLPSTYSRNQLLGKFSPCTARCLFLLGLQTQATMLHLTKKHHMCQCVCYFEGTLKQFSASSARMLKTNQHFESFQPQLQHKEVVLFCPATVHNNTAAQIKMKKDLTSDSHHVDTNKIEGTRPANSIQRDLSFTYFSLLQHKTHLQQAAPREDPAVGAIAVAAARVIDGAGKLLSKPLALGLPAQTPGIPECETRRGSPVEPLTATLERHGAGTW